MLKTNTSQPRKIGKNLIQIVNNLKNKILFKYNKLFNILFVFGKFIV